VVGRAIGYGVLSGAVIGILVMLGLFVGDLSEYALADLAAILVIYLPLALGAGAITGLLDALVAVAALLVLRGPVADHTGRARIVASVAAALPALALPRLGFSTLAAVAFALVSAGLAAFWTPRVVGATR
jgi:hypothetical protein